ncbi:hypothetical protein [Fuscibacter oryzae]|uniref:Uncharacterized protein n=1 Tax=Fuscibacter oryzae TaxID=2803939 RepID=A0A8J7MSL6_9RHOB|nr:hypothetical protein [Fuscibacter oryzae]MBL4928796.1 hypothetical protein [Fuscibacter oryzae]
MPHLYWTPERIAQLRREIDEFERVAFSAPYQTLIERKKDMTNAGRACSDDNVRSTLCGSVGYIAKHPDWVREAIAKARSSADGLGGR